MPTFRALAPLLLATAAYAANGEDLAKLYPATRGHAQQGLFPVATADDVWALKSFELDFGKDLSIKCKKATVVLGHDGTDVIWAVVLPEKPAAVKGAAAAGCDDARCLFLRFPPSDVGRVFPSKSVQGKGDSWLRHEALAIAQGRSAGKWSTPAGNPTIVQPGFLLIDVDSGDGELRRYWERDSNAGSLQHVAEQDGPGRWQPEPVTGKEATELVTEVWSAFDKEYAGFTLLPDLDWDAVLKRFQKDAKSVTTAVSLAGLIDEMLASLEDLHVWVKCGEAFFQSYRRERPMNGNWVATKARLKEPRDAGQNLVWGRTVEGLGYLGVHGLSDPELPQHFDEALEALKDTPGLLVDLRFNGGGDELLARALAGRFVAEPVVYSKNRYRSGSKRDALGPVLDRVLEPRGPWRYERPVVCLFGQRTMSSAESLAAMFGECPTVTTFGDRTAGSSANPRRLELAHKLVVNLPRWLDLLPDGTPLERHGVIPDVAQNHPADAFSERSDPVFEAAVRALVERTK